MSKEIRKKYQVWSDYGSEGWRLREFDTFTECVDFISGGETMCPSRITKTVEDDSYCNFIKP